MAYVKFWGVRGSIPTPGPSTMRYGGNTPCLELVYTEEKFFILDAEIDIFDGPDIAAEYF